MCTSRVKSPQIDGRAVLQPAGNRLQSLPSLEKKAPSMPSTNTTHAPSSKPCSVPITRLSPTISITRLSPKPCSFPITRLSPPISPKLIKPAAPGVKRGNDPNGLNSSIEKPVTPLRSTPTKVIPAIRKKSKKSSSVIACEPLVDLSTLIVEAPGTIAAARREQVSLVQAQRKMKIAHYGRTAAKLQEMAGSVDDSSANANAAQEEKRCSFITPNSDPLYVAYHDEEWGVPAHDDKMLFELLVLTVAQVGSDWTSILRKRSVFREAFSEFDVDTVGNFTEKQITSIIANYGLDSSKVRAAVDNAKIILQIRKEFGSFDAYLWGFVNKKPISTLYKSCRKIPVKTSKSETISKDMVRRGFRQVGPTVMHAFMQASGLTNDHLVSCPRHHECASMA